MTLIKKIERLNEDQLERFSRQILIKEIGNNGQIKIMNTPVIIIGCGGLGTTVATYLSMLGINNLGLADHDKVSLSNLNRQTLFDEENINDSKVKVIKKKLNLINSNMHLKIFDKKITTKNIDNIIKNYEIVLDCTDNFKSKYLINDQCFKYKKILISAALYNFELQLFAFRSWQKNSPCYRCIFPTKILNSQNCADIGILTTVAGMGGLLQANMTLNVILGNSKNIFNAFHIFNSISNENKKIRISKNKNCKVCRI